MDDELYRVPAYHRRHFKGKAVFKLPTIKHTPDQFHSSEWIAHNAAMEAKRPVLGKGPKPVIGCRYQGRVQRSPAFYAPAKRQRLDWRAAWIIFKDGCALIGAVVVLAGMYHIGAAVF